jgi:hypothetical protein
LGQSSPRLVLHEVDEEQQQHVSDERATAAGDDLPLALSLRDGGLPRERASEDGGEEEAQES